jgi:hypothetical protein
MLVLALQRVLRSNSSMSHRAIPVTSAEVSFKIRVPGVRFRLQYNILMEYQLANGYFPMNFNVSSFSNLRL